MKVLLVLPPTAEKPAYAEPPAGLLYVASALKRGGHEPHILDIYRNYIPAIQLLRIVKDNNYEVVGFGGITTCYWYVKEASRLMREHLPSVHQIAGGVLSSTYKLLLHNTSIDVVCLGEGEITVVNIVNRMAQQNREFDDINGVAFMKDKQIVKTPHQPYINNLDDIPIPDYDLINMDTYAFDAMRDPFFLSNSLSRKFYKKGMRVFNLKTARGCTNVCTFCYRHFLGYRQHSIDYVINHIRYLQEKYNIYYFRFGDELFTRNKEWVMNFAYRLREEDVKIKYIVHGIRTDNVDMELMDALKMSGCVTVFIGYESGSQKMLDVMRKNTTVEQNTKAVQTIVKSGLDVLVQIVIGMPGENNETIQETINSLIESGIDPKWVSINYAQAYPGTWLWHYAIKTGLIPDPEKYLVTIGKSEGFLLNYTSLPESETRKWRWLIYHSLLKQRYKKTGLFTYKIKALSRRMFTFLIVWEKCGFKVALRQTITYLLSLLKRN